MNLATLGVQGPSIRNLRNQATVLSKDMVKDAESSNTIGESSLLTMLYLVQSQYVLAFIVAVSATVISAAVFMRNEHLKILRNRASQSDEVRCIPDTYDIEKRNDPSNRDVVFGHPSIGGVIIAETSRVEMEYLDIDRSKALTRSPDQKQEDEFCKGLRQLGAQWWPNEGAYIDAAIGEGDTERYWRTVHTAWPSDGKEVWVLKYSWKEWSRSRNHKKVNLAHSLTEARNTDERVILIKALGGQYFEEWETCDELRMDTIK